MPTVSSGARPVFALGDERDTSADRHRPVLARPRVQLGAGALADHDVAAEQVAELERAAPVASSSSMPIPFGNTRARTRPAASSSQAQTATMASPPGTANASTSSGPASSETS